MNRVGLYLFILLGLFAACAKNKEQSLTTPEDKMVSLLADAHILEAALQDVPHKKKDSVKVAFYKQFFTIHKITKEEFVKNIEIMDEQAEMLSRIYSKVMEELSKLEAKKTKQKTKHE